MLRPNAPTGDLDLPNGDEGDANPSNPVFFGVGAAGVDGEGDADPDHGEDDLANRFGPFTFANGELVEAKARNPLEDVEPEGWGSWVVFSGGGDGLFVSRGLSSLSASSRGRLVAVSLVSVVNLELPNTFGPFADANGELDPA